MGATASMKSSNNDICSCGQCLPCEINGTFIPTEKGEIDTVNASNLDKTQQNIKDRFSLDERNY